MTDTGVPADHPSVDTVRAHLRRYGPGVRLLAPADERRHFAVGEVVRVLLDGRVRYARAQTSVDDAPFFPGVYDTPGAARDPSGTDRLRAWVDDRGLEADDPVLVDVLVVGERYGLREPGESVTYPDRRERDDTLADIARDL